ncbi:TolC family protein [Roseiconus lacunae]|uniref:TolC family protein n=1 Tax=Roseiconus lacunae TaxID=2605694 RepID=UPI001E3A8DD6|nr:TolC family protein [Roseiconus lacunae]MCD0462209.1 TolC family protein [Roseiconus lacunae]
MGKRIATIGYLGLAGVVAAGCSVPNLSLPSRDRLSRTALAEQLHVPAEQPRPGQASNRNIGPAPTATSGQIHTASAAAVMPRLSPVQMAAAWEDDAAVEIAAINAATAEAPNKLADLLEAPLTNAAESAVADRSLTRIAGVHPLASQSVLLGGNEAVRSDINGSVRETDATAATGLKLNLPSALAMVSAGHPVVGHARWRVQQAYAELDQAKVLWLPSIQAGFSFHRHDGNYQASDGSIVDVNRNSFQYGLGNRATGAGTTPNPGIIAEFHFADAIYLPRVAEKTAWARGHAAGAALNDTLRDVAVAYTDLVEAQQLVAILESTGQRTDQLAKLTGDFADAGEGLKADADRMQTELALVETRIAEAKQEAAMCSARLAQVLSLDDTRLIEPAEIGMIPLDLNPAASFEDSSGRGLLVATGLSLRPELKESTALVAAACEAYRREKYAPLVPSVLLGFSTGGFGGGLRDELDDIDSRYDFDAAMSWRVRNLGLGERAARRVRSAEVQQAKYERLQRMDQVAREITQAYAQVKHAQTRLATTRRAIETATSSYDRNLSRIRDGEGLPLEVLQSAQALETANVAYLRSVADYNRSQVQLQWAQGWPVNAPRQSSTAQ